MVITEAELVQTEEQVLSFLERTNVPSSPVELIDQLKHQQVAEHLIRAAIWYLIDRNEIEFTRDRLLKRAGTESDIGVVEFAPQR